MVKQFKNDYGTFQVNDWVCYGEYGEYYIGQITKIHDAQDKELMACNILVTHFMSDNEITLTTDAFCYVAPASEIKPLQKLLQHLAGELKERQQQLARDKEMINKLSNYLGVSICK